MTKPRIKTKKSTTPTPRYPRAPDLTIHVTQFRIDQAAKQNSSHCMIADSIKDDYEWAKSVSVDLQSVRVSDERRGLRYIYLTPRTAIDKLLGWDYGVKPAPFKVHVRGSAAHVVEIGYKKGDRAIRGQKAGARRVRQVPAKATFRHNGDKVPA